MLRFATDSDITLSSRFECKYLVSPMVVSGIREFIQPFMQPDRYAARHEGNRYPICSLYLDTPDLLLYQQTVGGDKNRFKLRIRTYDDEPTSPVFFEVKRKVNAIVQKRRARLTRDQTEAFLRRGAGSFVDGLSEGNVEDIEHFATHMRLADARPVVRVRYMREAYESRGGDPVRVTIDTELMHAVTLDNDLSHAGGRWVSTPVRGSILELKFTERYPSWINDMVHVFGLKQQPVPKYVLSIDHMLMEGRESSLLVSGFLLPPRRSC